MQFCFFVAHALSPDEAEGRTYSTVEIFLNGRSRWNGVLEEGRTLIVAGCNSGELQHFLVIADWLEDHGGCAECTAKLRNFDKEI